MDLVKNPQLPQSAIDKYERDAGRYWHLFYLRNEDRFFKDRHYFEAEFPELLAAQTVLEVGCGVGNTVFPLLELNPRAFVYACDFAPSAVALVRTHPEYASGRVHAFVADITATACPAGGAAARGAASAPGGAIGGLQVEGAGQPARDAACSRGGFDSMGRQEGSPRSLAAEVPAGSVDACTMVFVLSAISPERMPQAVRNVAGTLRPGSGQVLFRDYAAGDLAEERLAEEGRAQRIGDNFYARWDGTRAFYFTEEGVRALFEGQGFRCEYVRRHTKLVENRKKGACMHRLFVQGVFTYLGDDVARRAQQAQQRGGGELGGAATGKAQQCPARPGAGELRQVAGSWSSTDSTCRGSAGGPAEGEPEQQHPVPLGPVTFTLTGAAPSPAQLCLARLLLASPPLLLQRNVLELGSLAQAPTGLPSLAALRWCRFAVAAAPNAPALAAVRRNARANAALVVFERLRLLQLPWQGDGAAVAAGDAADAGPAAAAAAAGAVGLAAADAGAALLRAFPAGFDVIAAADPLSGADEGACEALARQLASFLACAPHALALLCQTSGGCSLGASAPAPAPAPPSLACVAAAAARLGLVEAPLPGEQAQQVAQVAGREGIEVLCLGWPPGLRPPQ